MASYTWNTGSGSFSASGNWMPAGPPGAADTANFAGTGGTISGTGAVATLNFQAGPGWTVGGQLSSGTINVNDPLAIASVGVLTLTSGALFVAPGQNATGSLTVNAGGSVTSTAAAQTSSYGLYVGGNASSGGANGIVTVQGAGASLSTGSNGATVGEAGAGTLSVLAGGTAQFASSNSAAIAALAVGRAGAGTVTVSGAGSALTANGYVYIGRAGSATLTVDQGGTFTGGTAATGTTGPYGITIGDGTPTLDASGNPNSPLYFGGTATASVTNTSTLHSIGNLQVGWRGSTGTLTVGSASTARSDRAIIVGGGMDRAGGNGTVTVQGGATLTSGGTHTLGSAGVSIGNDVGTTGAVTVSGTGSTLNANGDRLTVGGNGAGTLTISGGGRAQAGASYTDVEAAFAVAGGLGSTGTVTITGVGSQLTASGDAVIGGNEKGAGPVAGGAGTVVVSNGAALQTGAMTIEAGSSLTVDQASTLTTPSITLAGGTANLYTLSNATAVIFGTNGTLSLHALSGANTINSLTIGDRIDFAGMSGVSLSSSNTVTTSTGSLALNAAPAAAHYVLASDGNGGTELALNANTIGSYRFFDTVYGTHFFTSDVNERNAILNPNSPNFRPDLREETNGFGAIDPAAVAIDPNQVAVYRFFDQTTGTHFFTASAAERDSITNPSSPNYHASYVYEPGSTFYEDGTPQTGDVAVYRFFDSVHGTHFYTGDPSEYAAITTPGGAGYRADLTNEGIGFYAPAGTYS